MAGAKLQCWTNAAEIFNTKLTRDNKKRIEVQGISQVGPESPRNASQSLNDLLASARGAQAGCTAPSGSTRGKLEAIVQVANQYCPVADVMIQTQPHVTAIVWGAIRLLIGLAIAEVQAREEIGDVLLTIIDQIARFEEEAELFSTVPRVQAAVSTLFAYILNYLIRATSHLSKRYVVRSARAAFTLSRPKLKRILATIQSQTVCLDREIRTAAEVQTTDLVSPTLPNRLTSSAIPRDTNGLIVAQASTTLLFKSELEQAGSFRDASRKAIFHSDSKFSEQSRLITSLSAKQQKMILEGFTFHEDVRKTLDVQKQRDEAISWLGDGVETTDVVPPREQGTCLWIFEHPSFKRWVESEHAGCLWIHGIPGVGKSVLARTISETFEETASTNVVLTYFFKNAVNRTASQAPLFAASVLSQLCRSKVVEEHSQLCRVVEKVMAFRMRYNWVRSCPTDKILELLDTVLEVITECTFIVEGLDECTDFNETDDHLPRYLQRLGSRPNVTAIVLSRKYARFEKLFAKDSQLDMNHSVIEPDIMLYVKKEISRSSTLQPLASEITQKVVHCCDGMFLWTRLMLEYLKDARTVNVQKRRLSDFPPGLFSVYEQQIRETGAGLDEEGKILRRRVFLLLVGAVEPLSVHDVSTTMALDETSDLIDKNDEFLDPVREVLRLCWPLAMIVKERVYLVHMSVKEFLLLPRNPSSVQPNCLHMSLEDSNAFLAQKSLSKLSQSEYRSWRSSVTLLRKHLLTGGTIVSASQQDADPCVSTFADSVFYNYACLHWHEHVTALENPSDLIITKLSRFIIGNEFVTWSEVLFDLKNRIGLTPHVEVRSALKTWYKQRPSEIRERIPIGDYFEAPHNSLSHDFEARSQDKLLPYLPLIRLGEYFNLGAESRGDWQKAYEYLQAVVEGLQGLLGGRNPLTLRLRTSLLQQYFWQTRFDEAEQELLDVSGAQREFVGVDHPDLFITLQLLGLAQFYVNKFKASASTLEQSRKGLRQLLGPSNPRFLMTELYGGYALEAQARLDEAYERYQQILDVWEPITGPDNPLSLMASTAKGSVHRKRKQYVDAENAILNSFRARERLVGIGNNVCVDSAIQLAVLYREIRRGREAEEVLNVISASSIFPLDFHRDCQIVHLEALMRFDSGEYEKPRVTLQKLLERASGTNRDQNNRELLWVRIDLADVLCQHGENDQASMLFTDLVEPDNSPSASGNATPPPCAELASEPEPPTQLRIAEQALRYVRGSKPKAAERILAENRLRWVRRRDFWIMQGGPFTDTAWMSGPGHKPPPPSEGAILLESMSAS